VRLDQIGKQIIRLGAFLVGFIFFVDVVYVRYNALMVGLSCSWINSAVGFSVSTLVAKYSRCFRFLQTDVVYFMQNKLKIESIVLISIDLICFLLYTLSHPTESIYSPFIFRLQNVIPFFAFTLILSFFYTDFQIL
jgi:hypothetical protein